MTAREKEIAVSIALKTILLEDIDRNMVNAISNPQLLQKVGQIFYYSWHNVWLDYYHDDIDNAFSKKYPFKEFVNTAEILIKKLKSSRPVMSIAIDKLLGRWWQEYDQTWERRTRRTQELI